MYIMTSDRGFHYLHKEISDLKWIRKIDKDDKDFGKKLKGKPLLCKNCSIITFFAFVTF